MALPGGPFNGDRLEAFARGFRLQGENLPARTASNERTVVAPGVSFAVAGVHVESAAHSSQLKRPLVSTDKIDYRPGERVVIRGASWRPGETIALLIREQPARHADVTLWATADARGRFTNSQYVTEPHDLGVRFTLTATGPLSGTATVQFTDGHAIAFGPGGSNYKIAQSTGVIVPGTVDTGNHCDDCTTLVPLPFDYTLYNTIFPAGSDLAVSSNGVAQFVSDDSDFDNVCLPTGTFSYAILAHWDDLRTDDSGLGIFTSISGSAPNRIFNIEWRAVHFEDEDAHFNFEIRLYEGQARFDLIYGDLAVNNPDFRRGASATVGVQSTESTEFTEYSCEESDALPAGRRLTFTRNDPPTIASMTASPPNLFPSDRRMTRVNLTVVATDDSGVAPSCLIDSVLSNQAPLGVGPDIVIVSAVPPMAVDLRAERPSGAANRKYTITVKCTDADGAFSTMQKVVEVTGVR